MVDRIMAWFKSLPQRFINWWEKFTSRQKVAIVSLAVAVIAVVVIMVVLLSRPEYVKIYTASSEKEAQEVIELLKANEYEYKTDTEGLVISINKKDYTDVNLLLGSNDIYLDTYSIDNVTDGGFSTTEADKQKKYIVYLERLMKDSLETYDFVKTATVQLSVPEDDGTMIAKNTESSASVILELSGECTGDTAAGMARFIATALGNKTTENVVILDTNGTLLFSGTDESSTFGSASDQFALKDSVTNSVRNEVKKVLTATNEFSSIEVGANIVLDTSYTEQSSHEYLPDEGKDQGVLAHRDQYNSNSEGSVSGVPGTDSNTETTYQYENGEQSSSTVTEISEDFLPNEYTELKQIPAGAIVYDESSITVTCLKYNIIKEEDAKKQGLLDGITWDDYKIANDIKTKMEVDTDLYSAVSTATGIAVDDITILAYEEPLFIDKSSKISASDILLIVLTVLIIGLLVFVILRSMKASKEVEEEPEISIEEILKSTPPEEFEEIGVEDKSEARKMVEKFVEDNPDAAANLLRNWLTEEW